MFSGSDSTESQNYAQWPLNPSAYQSMQNEQVDWAALAHQWIKMKEAGPPMPSSAGGGDKLPSAPPPPMISSSATRGEAPMDVENDSSSNTGHGGDSNDGMSWQQQQQSGSWGWNNTASWSASGGGNKTPLLPTPAYNAYSSSSGKDDIYSSSSPNSSYWTGNGNSPNVAASSHSTKLLKPHNKRYSKVNIPLKQVNQSYGHSNRDTTPPPPIIDAHKRKQLPAWIREGLEKMERDKLKHMDRTRDRDSVEDVEEKLKMREHALEILKNTVRAESKPFNEYNDTHSESEDDTAGKEVPPPAPQISQPVVLLTHEERMLNVRRTMTEILLKVTNREIAQIAKEELQRHARKLKAVDQQVTAPSAGANLSARLGLGAYYGSGDSSEDSGPEEEKTEIDSDNELRNTIKRKKEEFAKVEREIEARLGDKEVEKSQRDGSESGDSQRSPPERSQDRRSRSPRVATRKLMAAATGRKRHSDPSSRSTSSSRSSSASSTERRSSRKERHRSRSSSRSRRRRSRRRSSSKRKRSRSRSPPYRGGSGGGYHRRRDSGSTPRHRRHSRRTRSRSRSYESGRGKRAHRH